MKIQYCSDYLEMSHMCSDSIISGLQENPDLLICTATGNSPLGVYENLAKAYMERPGIFGKAQILKLDEWGGIPSRDPHTCESYIRENILKPLHITKARYLSFESNPPSPEKECERVQIEIERQGPIDICILGLGQNGHIGFNEPSGILQPYCHVARLSEESLEHQMIMGMQNKPAYGLTLGMATILQSKKVLLLLTGTNKARIIERLLSKQITTHLPASFLWLHPHVECYVDANATGSAD